MSDSINESNENGTGSSLDPSSSSRPGMNSNNPHQDISTSSSPTNSFSFPSSSPSTSYYRDQHRLQLSSLHRSAEVARFQWLNENRNSGQLVDRNGDNFQDENENENENENGNNVQASSFQSELQVWDRLLSDIQLGNGTSNSVPSTHSTSNTASISPSNPNSIPSFSPFTLRGDPNSIPPSPFNPNARVLPHPIWARRYQGAAGEWLRFELARRAVTNFTPLADVSRGENESSASNRGASNGRTGIGSTSRGTSSRWGWYNPSLQDTSMLFPSLDPENRANRSGIEIGSSPGSAFLGGPSHRLGSGSAGHPIPSDSFNGESRYDTSLSPQLQFASDVVVPNASASTVSDPRQRARQMVAELARSRRERAVQRAEERRRDNNDSNNPNPSGRSRATRAADSFLNRLRRLDGLIPDEEAGQEQQMNGDELANRDPNGEDGLPSSASSSSSSFSSEAHTDEFLPIARPQDLFPWYGSSSTSLSTSSNREFTSQTPSIVRTSSPASPSTLFSRLSLSDSREEGQVGSNPYSSDPDGDLIDSQEGNNVDRSTNDRSSWYANARARMERAQSRASQSQDLSRNTNQSNTNNRLYDPPTLSPSNFDELLRAPSLPPVPSSPPSHVSASPDPEDHTALTVDGADDLQRIMRRERDASTRSRDDISGASRGEETDRNSGENREMIRERIRYGYNGTEGHPSNLEAEEFDPDGDGNPTGESETRRQETVSPDMSTLTSGFRPSPSGPPQSRLQRLRNRAALVMSDEGAEAEEDESQQGETTLGRRLNGRTEGGSDARSVERGWIVVEPSTMNTRIASSPPSAVAASPDRAIPETMILNSRRMSASPDQMDTGEASTADSSTRRSVDFRSFRAPRRLASLTQSDLTTSPQTTQIRSDSASTITSHARPNPSNRSGAPSPDSSDPDQTFVEVSSTPRPIPTYSSPIRRAEWMGSSRNGDSPSITPNEEPHPTRRDVGQASWEEHRERIARQALATMRNNETWSGSEAERAFMREVESDDADPDERQISQPLSQDNTPNPTSSNPSDRNEIHSQLESSLREIYSQLESSLRALSLSQSTATPRADPPSSARREFLASPPSRLSRSASVSSLQTLPALSTSPASKPTHSQDDSSSIPLLSPWQSEAGTTAFLKSLDNSAKELVEKRLSPMILRRLALLEIRNGISRESGQPSTVYDANYSLLFELSESSDNSVSPLHAFRLQLDDGNTVTLNKSKNVDLIFRFARARPLRPSSVTQSSFLASGPPFSVSRDPDQSTPLLNSNGSPNDTRFAGPRNGVEERVSQVRAEDESWRMARREIIMNPHGSDAPSSSAAERRAEMRRALGMPPRTTGSNFGNEEGEELLRRIVPTLAAQGGEGARSRFAGSTFSSRELEVLRTISSARASTSQESRSSAFSSLSTEDIRILRDLITSRVSLLSRPEHSPRTRELKDMASRFRQVLNIGEFPHVTPNQKELIARMFYCRSRGDGQNERSLRLFLSLARSISLSRFATITSLVQSRLDTLAPLKFENPQDPIFTMTRLKFKTSEKSGSKAVKEGLVFTAFSPIKSQDLNPFEDFNQDDLRCLAKDRNITIAGLEEAKVSDLDENQEIRDLGDPFAMERRRNQMEEVWISSREKLKQVSPDTILPVGYFSIDSNNTALLEFRKSTRNSDSFSSQGISAKYLAVKLLRNRNQEVESKEEGMELQLIGVEGWTGMRSRSSKGEFGRP